MLSNRKIGLLIPSPNVTIMPEMYSIGLEGVDFHAMRLRISQFGGAERLLQMVELAREGTETLMTAEVEAIIYGCTSGSFIKGPGFDKEVEKIIKEVAPNMPVVTTATAVVEALKSLKVSSVAVGTPYTEDVTERGKIFLEGYGFRVTKTHSLPARSSCGKCDITYRETMTMAYAINSEESEAIVLMCTALPTFGIIKRIEDTIKKPVVTANQASIWAMLHRLGIYRPIEKLGTLFL
jgi:maleate isomerase